MTNISAKKATEVLSRGLGFKVIDNRVEFGNFKIVTNDEGKDEEKWVVRATRPVGEWETKLWQECVRLTKEGR